MAPPADAARALQGSRARPAARPIVPAIPLAYTQKRKKQVIVPQKLDEPAPAVETVSAPSPPVSVEAVITNGSSVGPAASETEAALSSVQSPAFPVKEDTKEEAVEVQQSADAAHEGN